MRSAWPERDGFAVDGVWFPATRRLPPARLVRHSHVCPDGTEVTVIAQYIKDTGATLYRWLVNGQPLPTTTVSRNPPHIPPDWADIDNTHPAL